MNHPSILLESSVHERVEGFLKSHGLNYFHYRRCFPKGTLECLGTYSVILRLLLDDLKKTRVETFRSKELENLSSYSFLWQEMANSTIVKKAEENGYYSGVTFVYRYQNYYEVFALAMPKTELCSASFYMSKHRMIENFFLNFKYQNQDILDIASEYSFDLPLENYCENHRDLCLTKQEVSVLDINGQSVVLSSREAECLRLLRLGASNKEIARYLGLSHRSVETFVLRLRDKTGKSRSGLMNVCELCSVCSLEEER